jgi:uncharacterized protein (DUF58 family)
MNLKEIERVVATIQTQIFKKSNAWSSGALKSHFRGSGLQFREHQVYVAGDDVRFIDWNLSARTSNTYIKTFEEERNIEIVAFLDLSPTLLYGFKGVSKLQALIEMIALLYLLTASTQDLLRVVIWSNKTITLPPKRGREGLTLFISMLEKIGLIQENGKISLIAPNEMNSHTEEEKVIQIKSYLSRRKEVIYLGDMGLIENDELWNKLLDRKNMHCFKIFSPVDKNLNVPYLLKAKNPITGQGIMADLSARNSENLKTKKRYKEIGVDERYLEKFVKDLM